MRLALFAVLLAASTASAEGLKPYQSIQEHRPVADKPFALAINEPFGWPSGFAIAGSAYARVAAHHAVRLNVASYEYHANVGGDLIDHFVFGGDGDESGKTGRYFDVGASWMYFPRRVWDGPSFELGLLHRSIDTNRYDDFADDDIVDRDGQMIGARALLGWSWMIHDRVFISIAMGASKGYEFGTQVITPDASHPQMTTTGDYGEWTTAFEGNMRFGVAFGESE